MLRTGNNLGNYQISAYGTEYIAFQYPVKKYLKLFLISLGLAIVFGLAISDLLFGHEEMLNYLFLASLFPFLSIVFILYLIYAFTPTGFKLDRSREQIIFQYLGRKRVIPFDNIQKIEHEGIERFVTNGTASTTIDFTLCVHLKDAKKLNLYITTESFHTEKEKKEVCDKWNPVVEKLAKDVSAAVSSK